MTREKYESLPLATLKDLAKARKMRGISTMKKGELIDAMLALDEKEKQKEASEEAKEEVKEQLEVMESAMREGCIGQLPEIYDGGNPSSSKGCFAQAWSVGEILRVYEAVK